MNQWLTNNQNLIGGEGIIIEIDEAKKFGHREYYRERLIKGQWLFGKKKFLAE